MVLPPPEPPDPPAVGVPPPCAETIFVVGVGVGNGKMNLERQRVATTGLDPRQGFLPATRLPAELIVVMLVERVDADAGPQDARLFEGTYPAVGQRGAVGTDHHRQSAFRAEGDDVLQVLSEQRFSPGQYHHGLMAAADDLVQQPLYLGGT